MNFTQDDIGKAVQDRNGNELGTIGSLAGKTAYVQGPDGEGQHLAWADLSLVPEREGERAFIAGDLLAAPGGKAQYETELLVGPNHKLVWRRMTTNVLHVELRELNGSYCTTVAVAANAVNPEWLVLVMPYLEQQYLTPVRTVAVDDYEF